MARAGAWIIIVCNFLVHFLVSNTSHILFQIQTHDFIVSISVSQGIACLFYPLVGLAADIWFTRYKVIVSSAVVLLVTSVMATITVLAWLVVLSLREVTKLKEDGIAFIGLLLLIVMVVGIGMFEANAIQFGMDQLLEEPSEQMSIFIHWYYWSTGVGVVLLSVPVVGFLAVEMYADCTVVNMHYKNKTEAKKYLYDHVQIAVLIIGIVLQLAMAVVLLFVLLGCKKHLTIESAGNNPFAIVLKVLRYSWQHKCPENRSAFTYWEEDIPPRIDLGKNKYGGPFTTEEVEDTKTFLHILLLIISLFGFHLSGNGFTVTRQLMQKLCPSRWVLLLLFTSPPILDSLTTLVFIFTMQCLVLPYFRRCVPNLFKRLGVGLLLTFLQELVILIIASVAWTENYEYCYSSNHSVNRIGKCFETKFFFNASGSCQTLKSHYPSKCEDEFVSSIFSWILVPQILHSLSSVLVFMTALEFICAQAPLRMKGLLIGVWYASFVLRYLMNVADEYLYKGITWYIFHGVRSFLILVSVLLYVCVAKRYHYRVRNEVVNEQFLVEEIYERQLLQAEQYENERLHSSPSQSNVNYGSLQ